MKKVYIETLGCQMNKSDAERIYGILSHFGYSQAEEKDADFLIINTCSIRKLSEDKAYSRLGKWGQRKAEKHDVKIAICGCVAQQEGPKLLKRFPYVDLIFGTHNIYELPELINLAEPTCAVRDKAVTEKEFNITRMSGINAWLPIIEGCNNFCTYCVVPNTRGRERSREFDAIINEAKNIVAQGFKEITLLGQNVDSYGKDLEGKPTFAELLAALDKIEGKFRIRFTTSYPTDITDEVIEVVKNAEKICECFHIPIQSGNDRILKMMNRRYTRDEYFKIANKIRNNIENVAITSDIIAGFPSETEEEFLDSISAMKELELDYCNIAGYSPRPNTPAGKMKDKFVDTPSIKRRTVFLNDSVKIASMASNKKYIGKTLEVLAEKIKDQDGKRLIEGHTRNNKIAHFLSDTAQVGDFVNIKVTDGLLWCVKGDEVK